MIIILNNSAPANAINLPEEEELNILPFFTTEQEELRERQEIAHQMAECARKLGYKETNAVIFLAKEEWYEAKQKIEDSQNSIPYWQTKFEEYPYATYIWLYLTKQLKYSNEVAAGIMGNIMAECSGGSLDIHYWAYSATEYYYGICQWNKKNYSDVFDKGLEYQCNFLAKTIEYELNTFGYAYQKGYNYEDFLKLTTPKESALMFAKCYERCTKGTYIVRQKYANIAYNYYVTALQEEMFGLDADEG